MKTWCAILFLLVPGAVWSADLTPLDSIIAGPLPAALPAGATSGGDQAPRAIVQMRPDYPNDLRRAKIEGTVKVEFIVARDGSVQEAHAVESPHAALSKLAEAAVMKWKFRPGLRNGVTVATRMQVPMVFAAESSADLEAARKALAAHNYDQAIKLLTHEIHDMPQNEQAFDLRAAAYHFKKQDDLALADLNAAIQLNPTRADSFWERGQFLFEQGKYAAAVADFNACIQLAPKNFRGFERRALTYLGLHQNGKALADVNEAIRLNPQAAASYESRGWIYAAVGLEVEALDDYAHALTLEPTSSAARFDRADLLAKRGDYAGARDNYLAGLALNSKSARAARRLAWILAVCPDDKVRDGRSAVAYATQACELLNWKDAGMLDTLSVAYAVVGRFDLAEQWERKCLQLNPAEPEACQQHLALYREKKPPRDTAPDPEVIRWHDLRDRTFLMVWTTVNEAYYDPTFGGVDWEALQNDYRNRLIDVADNEHLRGLLQQMLGQLQRTHFAILPRESAVFNPAERVRIGSAGVECAWVDNRPVVTETAPDSPAARMGIHPGDAVLRIDGMELAPLTAAMTKAGVSPARIAFYVNEFVESRLSAAAGTKVQLEVSGPDGVVRTVAVTCAPRAGRWSDPIGNYPSMPIHFESRHDAGGIAYLRFGIFAPQVMKDIRAFLRTLRPDEGLVIDLRGNPGGVSAMASGLAGFLSQNEYTMGTMHLRQGQIDFEVYPQERSFAGPIAVLIDGRSASTSEIFAAGLQASHRARVFGEPSAGAALPSSFKALPTGDLFQYAIADIKTSQGVLLEGQGVMPDTVVKRSPAEMAAHVDSVLAAALAWLGANRRAGISAPPVAAQ